MPRRGTDSSLDDGVQLAYGLGTANARKASETAGSLDEELVDITTKAITAGYSHLDGAEGMCLIALPMASTHGKKSC